MDGIPALTLWDLVIEVFHSSPNHTNKTKDDGESRGNLSAKTHPNMRKQIPTTHTNLDLTNVDHVPSSVTHSGSNATLHVFEDNEKRQQRAVGTLVLWNRDNGLTLKWRSPRILIVFKCQNSLLDCFDTANKFVENNMGESIVTKLLKNARKSHQTIQDIGQTNCCSNSPLLRIGHLIKWISVLAKGGGQKKSCQYCVNPNCFQ